MKIEIWNDKLPDYRERMYAIAFAFKMWMIVPDACTLTLVPKE